MKNKIILLQWQLNACNKILTYLTITVTANRVLAFFKWWLKHTVATPLWRADDRYACGIAKHTSMQTISTPASEACCCY